MPDSHHSLIESFSPRYWHLSEVGDKTKRVRTAVRFGVYLLVPVAWLRVSRHADLMAIAKSLVFLILPTILVILAMLFLARCYVCRTRQATMRIGYEHADRL